MISGGEFKDGKFSEDELHGEAFEELKCHFRDWKLEHPDPVKWPNGTTFSQEIQSRRWTRTVWAILPSGVRYELLIGEGGPDPVEAPEVIWSIMVDPNGTIYAHPRIAQMKVTIDPPHTDERLREAHAGVPLGLQQRYEVGRMSRPLREKTHTVSDGWSF